MSFLEGLSSSDADLQLPGRTGAGFESLIHSIAQLSYHPQLSTLARFNFQMIYVQVPLLFSSLLYLSKKDSKFPYPLSDFLSSSFSPSSPLLCLPPCDRLLSGILKGCSWRWPADLLPWELQSMDSIYPLHTEGHTQLFPVPPHSPVKVCPPLLLKPYRVIRRLCLK